MSNVKTLLIFIRAKHRMQWIHLRQALTELDLIKQVHHKKLNELQSTANFSYGQALGLTEAKYGH